MPWCATSNRPSFCETARVKAPPRAQTARFPEAAGIAAQSTFTIMFCLRRLPLCSARAISSLPYPFSIKRTVNRSRPPFQRCGKP